MSGYTCIISGHARIKFKRPGILARGTGIMSVYDWIIPGQTGIMSAKCSDIHVLCLEMQAWCLDVLL